MVQPIRHKVVVTRERVLVTLVVIWTSGFVYSLIVNVTTSAVEDGQCRLLAYWTSQEAKLFFGVVNSSLRYVIPCLVFILCYSHMAWFLHKRKFVVGVMTVNSSVRESNMERARNNVLKTLIYVGVANIFCSSWNQILFILFNAGILEAEVFSTAFFRFSVAAYYSNLMVNPFIYALKYKQFQKSAKMIFCKPCQARTQAVGSSTNPSNSNSGRNTMSRDLGTPREELSTMGAHGNIGTRGNSVQ